MQDWYFRLASESRWFSEKHPSVKGWPAEWSQWLLNRESLTTRLMDYSQGDFEVKVVSQRWGLPLLHEAKSLGIPMHMAARIREVELHCHGSPVVYARSVMPLTIFLEQRYVLANIGTRPLGHLLFKDGRMRASKRSLSIFQLAGQNPVYGRSTPYRYADKEILVSEFFISDALLKG
jgi:chorismate--pyruvate lyase